ncbi:1501_t:CDS:1, partial [Racocetra fulgida]
DEPDEQDKCLEMSMNQMNGNRQEGYTAYIQSDSCPLEEPTLLDEPNPPIDQTHIQPPWNQLLQHMTNLMSKQQEASREAKEHQFVNIIVFI